MRTKACTGETLPLSEKMALLGAVPEGCTSTEASACSERPSEVSTTARSLITSSVPTLGAVKTTARAASVPVAIEASEPEIWVQVTLLTVSPVVS